MAITSMINFQGKILVKIYQNWLTKLFSVILSNFLKLDGKNLEN